MSQVLCLVASTTLIADIPRVREGSRGSEMVKNSPVLPSALVTGSAGI